jgi:hypothetical protein
MKKVIIIQLILISSIKIFAQCSGGNACGSLGVTRPDHVHTYLKNNDSSRRMYVYYCNPLNYGYWSQPVYVDIAPTKSVAITPNAGLIHASFSHFPGH